MKTSHHAELFVLISKDYLLLRQLYVQACCYDLYGCVTAMSSHKLHLCTVFTGFLLRVSVTRLSLTDSWKLQSHGCVDLCLECLRVKCPCFVCDLPARHSPSRTNRFLTLVLWLCTQGPVALCPHPLMMKAGAKKADECMFVFTLPIWSSCPSLGSEPNVGEVSGLSHILG